MADIRMRYGGLMSSAVMLVGESDRGTEWMVENLPDANWMGEAVPVEMRYVADILDGMDLDGLTIEEA